MPWHATAKASLQNHFDGEMKLEVLARHRLLNKQVHVPAVTVAHLNAAAVSNTAITPSSSLHLPMLSSRRSAGARRVATAARAAAAAAVALSPTQCHFCRRGSAALPPGIRTRVRSENWPLCVTSIHLSRKLNSVFQSLTASPAPLPRLRVILKASRCHTYHTRE